MIIHDPPCQALFFSCFCFAKLRRSFQHCSFFYWYSWLHMSSTPFCKELLHPWLSKMFRIYLHVPAAIISWPIVQIKWTTVKQQNKQLHAATCALIAINSAGFFPDTKDLKELVNHHALHLTASPKPIRAAPVITCDHLSQRFTGGK